MEEIDLKKELKQLKQSIHFHNYRYHTLDTPLISDFEFDHLLTRLHEIEKLHPEWVTYDSPTQRAGGAPADKFD